MSHKLNTQAAFVIRYADPSGYSTESFTTAVMTFQPCAPKDEIEQRVVSEFIRQYHRTTGRRLHDHNIKEVLQGDRVIRALREDV